MSYSLGGELQDNVVKGHQIGCHIPSIRIFSKRRKPFGNFYLTTQGGEEKNTGAGVISVTSVPLPSVEPAP